MYIIKLQRKTTPNVWHDINVYPLDAQCRILLTTNLLHHEYDYVYGKQKDTMVEIVVIHNPTKREVYTQYNMTYQKALEYVRRRVQHHIFYDCMFLIQSAV